MMKRNSALAISASLLALSLLLSGCGGAPKATAESGATASPESPGALPPAYDMQETREDQAFYDSTSAGGQGQGSAVYRDEHAKLIREADLTIQTTEFDAMLQRLNQMTVDAGGYYQRADIYSGSHQTANASRWGDYVIRIPAQQYDTFISQLGALGYVTARSETSTDVGEQYYDTENRLHAQQTKYDRLLALLEKADTMEAIIALEQALSETEYQIQSYSSALNQYDSLVSFATVRLNLEETMSITDEPGQTSTLGTRMSAGFSDSLRRLGQGFEDLLVNLSYNFFGLLIFVVAVGAGTVIIVTYLKKTTSRGTIKKGAKPEEPKPRDDEPKSE